MGDADQSKLFVGGISWETTDEILKEHFGDYGTVLSSAVARDRNSRVPRGFAFVTFSEPSSVDRALQDSHQILNRTVEVKRAIPRSERQSQHPHNRGSSRKTNYRGNEQFRTKKIFVGGLSANLNEEDFRRYFEKFGRITDVVVMHDNMTHRPRGFGFITFDSEDSVEEVMQTNFHELTGKLVEVKRAVPKDGNSNSCYGYNGRLGGGRSQNVNAYQQFGYPTQSPGLGILPSGYASFAGYPYESAIYNVGYPTGSYMGFSYGFAPISPRNNFNSGAVGVRVTAAPFYPAYLNSSAGVMGMSANGYYGILGDGFDIKSGQLEIEHAQGQRKQSPKGNDIDKPCEATNSS